MGPHIVLEVDGIRARALLGDIGPGLHLVATMSAGAHGDGCAILEADDHGLNVVAVAEAKSPSVAHEIIFFSKYSSKTCTSYSAPSKDWRWKRWYVFEHSIQAPLRQPPVIEPEGFRPQFCMPSRLMAAAGRQPMEMMGNTGW